MIARLVQCGLALAVVLSSSNCATPEPRPAGVGRGISFVVTPLYPRSYEITAEGSRLRDATELQEAWRKKAILVANGRNYKITTPPVAHDNESDLSGGPLLTRSVTGTIAITD